MDLVVPVPLHRRRLAKRGYNQAALLAASLAKALDIPLLTSGLIRVRDTGSQARLDAAARKKNLQGAFCANTRLFSGARVLLVDDVVTTTATCRAASLALRNAGAREVQVACLLRAT
jgi:ComF family protein